MKRLDPPMTAEESNAISRLQRDARTLTDAQVAQGANNIILYLGNAIARERRQAVAEALAEVEPEIKRLRLIEKAALAVVVEEAQSDDEPETLESIEALREAIGEDVVDAAVDGIAGGLGEDGLG